MSICKRTILRTAVEHDWKIVICTTVIMSSIKEQAAARRAKLLAKGKDRLEVVSGNKESIKSAEELESEDGKLLKERPIEYRRKTLRSLKSDGDSLDTSNDNNEDEKLNISLESVDTTNGNSPKSKENNSEDSNNIETKVETSETPEKSSETPEKLSVTSEKSSKRLIVTSSRTKEIEAEIAKATEEFDHNFKKDSVVDQDFSKKLEQINAKKLLLSPKKSLSADNFFLILRMFIIIAAASYGSYQMWFNNKDIMVALSIKHNNSLHGISGSGWHGGSSMLQVGNVFQSTLSSFLKQRGVEASISTDTSMENLNIEESILSYFPKSNSNYIMSSIEFMFKSSYYMVSIIWCCLYPIYYMYGKSVKKTEKAGENNMLATIMQYANALSDKGKIAVYILDNYMAEPAFYLTIAIITSAIIQYVLLQNNININVDMTVVDVITDTVGVITDTVNEEL